MRYSVVDAYLRIFERTSMSDNSLKFAEFDLRGIRVFNKSDVVRLFSVQSSREAQRLLRGLVDDGILERVARGVYVNRLAHSKGGYLIEEIACVLRRGYFNYVSLESILSEFGVISQVMISRITIMTSGCRGLFKTPYGTIEFTHTARRLEELRERTIRFEGRPLLLATKEAGFADLMRVGRNVNMLDPDELETV